MDRDVVEGNPTLLETSSRFPDPPESYALVDLSHMHMNDLGLTPSPGHQLQGDISQNEEKNCFNECGAVAAGGRDALKQTDIQTSLDALSARANDTFDVDDNLYDSLFDSAIPELDSIFSRKRTAEELELPPEKRQHLETPAKTPSLTPDLAHESQVDFFDNFDKLFADGFDSSLFPGDALPDFEEEAPQFPLSPPVSPPVVSETTKERFSLDAQDILASSTQEVLQVTKVPEYTSPYPVAGGRLGYLPSTPGLYVKCVAVGEAEKDKHIANLQAQVFQLTRERDFCKKSLSRYERLDPTGKSAAQLLEENMTLRRVSARHQARVDEYRKDATEWRNKLHALSTIYNNLLYEIQVEKRVPTVDSTPHGYQPRQLSASLRAQIADHFGLNRTPTPVPPPQISLQHTMVIPDAVSQHVGPTAQPPDRPRAVMIDLTEEDEDPSRPPTRETEHCTTTLQSLRTKKYDWLQTRNHAPRSILPPSPSIDDDELALLMEEELSRT
ncbi:hypothetical protein BDV12DRAFT_170112 [Aspergillus spectabilis]